MRISRAHADRFWRASARYKITLIYLQPHKKKNGLSLGGLEERGVVGGELHYLSPFPVFFFFFVFFFYIFVACVSPPAPNFPQITHSTLSKHGACIPGNLSARKAFSCVVISCVENDMATRRKTNPFPSHYITLAHGASACHCEWRMKEIM